jgi:phospholipase/carboxylesterase
VNRRELLGLFGTAILAGCAEQTATARTEPGVLTARPRADAHGGKVGTFRLGSAIDRDGFIHVPRTGTLPVIVMLHGATQRAEPIIERYRGDAGELGFIILAPDSRGTTWDRVRGEFGDDIRFIDRALNRVFSEYPVDAQRVAIAGFSDGASYALSVGMMNGDLFSHVMAFSPGFAAPADLRGKPRIFVSHGTEDEILPIDRTSRQLVPRLREAGYVVAYEEFDGPHTVPHEIARRAFAWFMN